jgi:hypothetical protein
MRSERRTSSGEKPTSANLSKISVMVSKDQIKISIKHRTDTPPTKRFRDEANWGRSNWVGTAEQELELGSPRAVADPDCTSELDQISRTNVVASQDRSLCVDNIISAKIGREVGFLVEG